MDNGVRYDWITFLSDYGLDDLFVGVCKGVLAQRAPHATVIDLCHQISRQDVRHGASVLAASVDYLPVGVHLALVDPMDSAPKPGVVIRTETGSMLVGPDNGLLWLAAEALGPVAAHAICNDELWLPRHSRTFRGRDVFSPVAAHLAAGGDLAAVGPRLDPADLVRLTFRRPAIDDDHVHGEVQSVDHFGNLSLNVERADLEAAGMTLGDNVELRCSGRAMSVPFALTYGEVPPGRLALCEDSFRAVMIAVNLGSAADALRARPGDPVVVARVAQTSEAARLG